MDELLNIPIVPLVVTLLAYQIGLWCQKRFHTPLCNPILIGVVLVMGYLFATGTELSDYQAGAGYISWLLTPVTVCLAIPMYEQLQVLLTNRKAILAGIAAGTVASLLMVAAMSALAGFDPELTVTMLPKSVTSAIGAPLSQLNGGMASVTTAVIIFSGIFANALSPVLIRLFRLEDEISAGVAMGTSGHAIATSRANEMSPLTGAISSLSLVTAGILTSILFPLAVQILT